jgi:ABC-2 type transport system permease protein
MRPAPRRTIVGALRELVEARQILANMIRRDFSAKHKNSFFGMAWSLVNPMLLVAIFSFVFYFLGAQVQGEKHYSFAIFFFCGITLWNFFSGALTGATGSIVAGGYLLKKVYFPRDILPLSQVFAALITFAFEFVVLMVAAPFFHVRPHWTLVFVPLVLVETFLLAYAAGLLLAGLTVVFRDIEHFIGVLMQVLFWGSGVIYDLSLISRKSPWVAKAMKANPVLDLIEAFRAVVLDGRAPSAAGLAYVGAFGLLLYLLGARSFNAREPGFAELI